jgi:DNA adenine methylase
MTAQITDSHSTDERRKPLLRWAGSKRQLLPRLRSFWSTKYRTYLEPFCGSACLFFSVSPGRAVLGDLNSELITTYRQLQLDPYKVIECLRRLPRGKSAYYEIRAVDAKSIGAAEAAARFIYLNHYCFNGLYRTNANGRFNVPFGRHKKPREIDEALIISAAESLRNAFVVDGDFEQTLSYAHKGDFIYLDPPYVTSRDESFREYGPTAFAEHDLTRLSSRLIELDRRRVHFVVSYCDSRLARRAFGQWRIKSVLVRRNIAGFTGSRRHAREIIVTNIDL